MCKFCDKIININDVEKAYNSYSCLSSKNIAYDRAVNSFSIAMVDEMYDCAVSTSAFVLGDGIKYCPFCGTKLHPFLNYSDFIFNVFNGTCDNEWAFENLDGSYRALISRKEGFQQPFDLSLFSRDELGNWSCIHNSKYYDINRVYELLDSVLTV